MTPTDSQTVWRIFSEILRIPRPSGHEEKMIAYLTRFAEEHSLPCKVDQTGNVLVSKPGAAPAIALQAHMDMVCEKEAGCRHDFLKDPIETRVEDGWMRACGTTLGADDGIGVALCLTALLSDTPRALEALFTVDEETGLTGAEAVEPGWLQATELLNLDSEEDDELIIGCAGGCETTARMAVEENVPDAGSFAVRLSVKGLRGGHSGSDIHLRRANALKLLCGFLTRYQERYPLRLARLEGGGMHNAIPRQAEAVAVIPAEEKERVRVEWNLWMAETEDAWKQDEPGLEASLESCGVPPSAWSAGMTRRALRAVMECPHGVQAWSRELEGVVETSTNLASARVNDGQLVIVTSQRSSKESELDALAFSVYERFAALGAVASVTGRYTPWQPDFHSPLVERVRKTYRRLEGEEIKVKVIHAGLECGLFQRKYPRMAMVSFGPTLRDVHSPSERLKVSSVDKVWRLLRALIG